MSKLRLVQSMKVIPPKLKKRKLFLRVIEHPRLVSMLTRIINQMRKLIRPFHSSIVRISVGKLMSASFQRVTPSMAHIV